MSKINCKILSASIKYLKMLLLGPWMTMSKQIEVEVLTAKTSSTKKKSPNDISRYKMQRNIVSKLSKAKKLDNFQNF